jgi:O-antigen/teichoic acid export membrane protein
MSESLKTQTIKGVGWSAVERFSAQGASFVVQIVLARLLTPADYGIVGMVAIFIQIAQVLVDSGFANALIKKQNCSNDDYSTVFFFNLIISISIYLLFVISAPFVSDFYNERSLTLVMQVITFTIVLNALSIVPRTVLVKAVNFKDQTAISVSSVIISGIIGICLAFCNYGVWSLVAQQLSNSIIQIFLFAYYTKWYPRFIFSKSSFNELFAFGYKLLAASIVNTIYRNIYTIVIGKRYSSVDLGYFTRAEQFAMFPSHNIGNIISRVVFPVFSKIQDNNDALMAGYRKIIRISSYMIFPLMTLLIALSEPLVIFFLTEKWKSMIILLQILSIDWMLDHLSLLNLNILFVKGRSDLVLKLEIVKKTIALVILCASIPFGLVVMCWGRVLYSILATIINMYYTKSLIGLSISDQLKDISPYLFASIVMGLVAFIISSMFFSSIYSIIVGSVVAFFVYLLITVLFFRDDIVELIRIRNEYLSK